MLTIAPLQPMSPADGGYAADSDRSRHALPPPVRPPLLQPPAAPSGTGKVVGDFASTDGVRRSRITEHPEHHRWRTILGISGIASVLGIAGWQFADPDRSNGLAPQIKNNPAPVPALALTPAATVPPLVLDPTNTANATLAGTSTVLPRPLPQAQAALPPPALRQYATSAEPPIRFTHSQPVADDALLSRGHDHLQHNDLDAARRDFELALQRDPNHSDLLLALAAIAQRQGNGAEAQAYRQRGLIANPGDPAVQAAVLNNVPATIDQAGTESRLKTLLAAQPESAPLNFALANLYAHQQRWPEAQQHYFNAVAADGDNPDYLFNLAVGLDHLRQTRLAVQHYRLALEAANQRPAAFERTHLEQRLIELAPQARH